MPIQSVSLTNTDAEDQALDRQRQLALLLQNQSMQPIESAMGPTGVAAPISITQGLGKILQAYMGARSNNILDEKIKAKELASNQALAQGLMNYHQTLNGTPAVEGQIGAAAQPERPYSPMEGQGMPLAQTPSDVPQQQPIMAPSNPGQPTIQPQAAVPGDRQAALAQLLASGSQPLQQMGMAQMIAEPDRQQKQEEFNMLRQDKMSQFEQQQAQLTAQRQQQQAYQQQQMEAQKQARETASMDRRAIADQASQDRRFSASQNQAMQNKPPAGYRFAPDGSLEAIKGGPADQKLNTALSGKETVSNIIGGLRDAYNKLSEGSGITDPNKGALSNMAAGASSSEVGQAVGRMFGTQNQSVRNTVTMTRPLLLQAIMKATGMSAKQMDSNTELKLYLSTATDPTLDIEANKHAMDKLEQLYGSGSQEGAVQTQQTTPAKELTADDILKIYKK